MAAFVMPLIPIHMFEAILRFLGIAIAIIVIVVAVVMLAAWLLLDGMKRPQ